MKKVIILILFFFVFLEVKNVSPEKKEKKTDILIYGRRNDKQK